MGYGWGNWRPYVPVARRRANAQKHATKLAKNGRKVQPVQIDGKKIVTTFWGRAWCENLECYSDYANRLPRGRSYVRNGSVVDLQIDRGSVKAIVAGSAIYNISITISPLDKQAWKCITQDCARSIDSLIDLLQGRFDRGVMERLTRQKGGLFPKPGEISLQCDCPDSARLCKHLAATLYGVGARLDHDPQMLFLLRGVDHLELIGEAVKGASLDAALSANADASLAGADLGELFGIDIENADQTPANAVKPRSRVAARTKKASTKPSAASGAPKIASKKTAASKNVVAESRGAKRPSKKSATAVEGAASRKKAATGTKKAAQLAAEKPVTKAAKKKTGKTAKSAARQTAKGTGVPRRTK